MEQVLKLESNGMKYVVKYDKESTNPYRVYKFIYGIDKYGYQTCHRKQIAKYADMRSCLLLIASDDAFSE